MDRPKKRALKDRIVDLYWIVVGLVGMGRPIVDRRSMFGDDRRNDPYSIYYDPTARR